MVIFWHGNAAAVGTLKNLLSFGLQLHGLFLKQLWLEFVF